MYQSPTNKNTYHYEDQDPLALPQKQGERTLVLVDQSQIKATDNELFRGVQKKVGISFNAGGIRGYLSALVVRQMEQDMGMPINQFVDVFSGVSIGCILSSLYALGVSSDVVVNLFET